MLAAVIRDWLPLVGGNPGRVLLIAAAILAGVDLVLVLTGR